MKLEIEGPLHKVWLEIRNFFRASSPLKWFELELGGAFYFDWLDALPLVAAMGH